ncbi:MAG: hypothetical protein JNJ73_12800 [Hyphomonadaceae bacterium]|nr:hypothetical protein [Hyphomonadaceae bacterium]
MLTPDYQPFALLGAALVIFFFSTRSLPLGMRVLAWLVGAGLTIAAWFGGPMVPTDFGDLVGLLGDMARRGRESAIAEAFGRNLATAPQSLNATFDIVLLAVAGLGLLSLFGFAPRRDDGERSERPLLVGLFGMVLGAILSLAAASALGFFPTRTAYFARGEDVAVVSGDMLRMGDVTLQLAGIDAPEFYPQRESARDPRTQTCLQAEGGESACGEAAMKAVAELVQGGMVFCTRLLAASAPVLVQCRVRKGGATFDLAARTASLGFAAASEDAAPDYAREISAAESAGRGFWSACSLSPAAWRNPRLREAFRARKFEEIAAADFVGRERCPASATPPPPPPAPEPPAPRRRRAD